MFYCAKTLNMKSKKTVETLKITRFPFLFPCLLFLFYFILLLLFNPSLSWDKIAYHLLSKNNTFVARKMWPKVTSLHDSKADFLHISSRVRILKLRVFFTDSYPDNIDRHVALFVVNGKGRFFTVQAAHKEVLLFKSKPILYWWTEEK